MSYEDEDTCHSIPLNSHMREGRRIHVMRRRIHVSTRTAYRCTYMYAVRTHPALHTGARTRQQLHTGVQTRPVMHTGVRTRPQLHTGVRTRSVLKACPSVCAAPRNVDSMPGGRGRSTRALCGPPHAQAAALCACSRPACDSVAAVACCANTPSTW